MQKLTVIGLLLLFLLMEGCSALRLSRYEQGDATEQAQKRSQNQFNLKTSKTPDLKFQTFPIDQKPFLFPELQKREIEIRSSPAENQTLYSYVFCNSSSNGYIYQPCGNGYTLFLSANYHTHNLIYNPQTGNYFGVDLIPDLNGGVDLAAYVLNIDGSLQTLNVLIPASSFPQTISNPTAALSLTHQQYLVVFGYGNVNNAAPTLVFATVSFQAQLTGYLFANSSLIVSNVSDVIYNPVLDQYVVALSSYTAANGYFVGFLAVAPQNGSILQQLFFGSSIASETDLVMDVSDDGQYYVAIVDLEGVSQNDLLLMNVTAYPLNVTNNIVLGYTLNNQYQLSLSNPLVFNSPVSNDFVVVMASQIPSIQFYQIMGLNVDQYGNPSQNVYYVSPADNNTYQNPTLAVMGKNAFVGYQQLNGSGVLSGMFTVLDIATFVVFEILQFDQTPAAQPYAAYNTNSSALMILLEVDSFPISTTAMPPSTTGSNPTPSHSMSSVLKLDWFVLVGMLLAAIAKIHP